MRPGPRGMETLEQSEHMGLGDSGWGMEARRGFWRDLAPPEKIQEDSFVLLIFSQPLATGQVLG